MIHFGPAGNCQRFYDEGCKGSEQAPAWIAAQGLNAYEYAAGHGVSIGEEKARLIGMEAQRAGVAVSIHAPYYINGANPEKLESNVAYLLAAAHAVKLMGGGRVVFHPGSPSRLKRETALQNTLETVALARKRLDDAGCADILLCPETMGRPSQLGTLDEIIALCQAVPGTLPTIDFAHLHAITLGAMTDEAAFENVIVRLINGLGYERVRHFHAHFSRIAFTNKGEKCHMTFADTDYGPDFACLAPVLRRHALEPTIICESRGTQADDAMTMKAIYEAT